MFEFNPATAVLSPARGSTLDEAVAGVGYVNAWEVVYGCAGVRRKHIQYCEWRFLFH